MFPLASDSMPWVSQGQLYKGAFWCPFCFPFAQTDVRLTLPGMTRGWHENAMRYLQANFAISDTPAALLGSGGLGQRSCQVALAMAGAGRCCSASSHLTRPHPICRGCAQNALTPNLHPSGPLTSADVQGAWGQESKARCLAVYLCLPWESCLKGLFYSPLYIFSCSYWPCPCLCIYEKRAVHILGHCMLSWTLGVQLGIPCAEMDRAFVCPSTANLILFNSCVGQRWLLSPSSRISH